MNDADIQFGEIAEAEYRRRRRPDEDGHFAVVAYGQPKDDELPIFIDMDVLADVEIHSREDTTVELGGVLLGGQYVDQQERPFVMVRDSIRAEAYESSRGHFKFTQETWTRISRRRDTFNEDLQMVGWYHTHPGWGVFLSSMDRFICDHFFSRQLDVAYVVDPIALDRGWFYWNRAASDALPRAGGFYVTASRFRKKELADFVAALQGDGSVRAGNSDGDEQVSRREIVHLWRPQLGWLGAALVAILALQCCLMLMVVWMTRPSPERVASAPAQTSEADERHVERDVFDHLLAKVKIDEQGNVDLGQVAEEYHTLRERSEQADRTQFLLDELTDQQRELHSQLQAREATIRRLMADQQRLSEQLALAEDRSDRTINRHTSARKDTRVSQVAKSPADDGEPNRLAMWLGLGLFALLITGGVAGPWLLRRFATTESVSDESSRRAGSSSADASRQPLDGEATEPQSAPSE